MIDNVVESISAGLEQHDFKNNQRRIAEVKYLAEIYNYRLVEHAVVFDAMYKIMTFGHGGPPVPGRLNPFDMPDDFFRIRLIYFILEASGVYFNKGPAGKKLDYFLSFLQVFAPKNLRKTTTNTRLVLHLHQESSAYGYRISSS